jgi:hypothetical protein
MLQVERFRALARFPLASRRVVIDEELLIEAVRALNAQGRPARSDTVSIELGASSDNGEHRDVVIVADDLAELESHGKLERAAAFEWEGIGPPPKTLIAYAAQGEQ